MRSIKPSDKSRKLDNDRFDVLSIPHYVIKKGPSRGARHGPTMMQRIYHIVHNSRRKTKKQDYKSILDRFLNSPRYRESQIATGWDEALCARYDEIALKDHSYVATKAERSRHENSWKMVFNSSGPNGLMDQHDDCEGAKRTLERLYKEQGNCNAKIQTQRSTSTTARPRVDMVTDGSLNKFIYNMAKCIRTIVADLELG